VTNRAEIDGLSLPEYLVELVKQDRWKVPANTTVLKRLVEFTGNSDIGFIRVENMVRFNERTDLFEDPKIARIYGLASSTQVGQEITEPGILDVDKAIMIALNWDEEAISLDYRPNIDAPCVMSGIIVENKNIVWKKIADDFKSFADHIGL
jgi:hypothetical protein